MLSIKEKIAYGLGDTASNIIFQTVMLFLTFFYTDIFGLSPTAVGGLFLTVRIIDAVTDPLMGALADRTQSRWGKFRPYLLWTCVPFGIISVLAFSTPDLSADGKKLYAYITYTLLMLAYTAINIPYSALGGVLTDDPSERVSVQSYRFVFGMLGGLLIATTTMPLVAYFGEGDQAKGYQLTMMAMSVLGVLLFLLCFVGTKERVTQANNPSMTITENLRSLWQNDQWRILCMVAFVLLTGMVLRSTLTIYYVKYVLVRADLITTFITLGMIGNILGCACAQPLAKRVSKIKAYIGLQVIAALICFISFFIKPDQIVFATLLYFLWGFFLQMATPLLWAKIADTVDYGHWKNGIRINGMVYSAVVFFIKLGLALGGALAAWLLAFYQYQPDFEQTMQTKQGILLSFTLLPAISSLIVAWLMSHYTLDDHKILQIRQQMLETSNP